MAAQGHGALAIAIVGLLAVAAVFVFATTVAVNHYRRVSADMKRKLADHQPERGDQVEAWLIRRRDEYESDAGWWVIDELIDDYRQRADAGALLHEILADLDPEELG